MAPGDREGSAKRTGTTEGLEGDWRLAVGRRTPGGDDAEVILQARGAWRCVIPAKQSGAKFRLAACDARQAVLVS